MLDEQEATPRSSGHCPPVVNTSLEKLYSNKGSALVQFTDFISSE
jgi:hypothetical protein